MELMHNTDKRTSQLIEYFQILCEGTTDKGTYESYRDVLETATAYETNAALDALLSETEDIEAYTIPVSRFIRSVGKGLESATLPDYQDNALLISLAEENVEIAKVSSSLQQLSIQLKKEGDSDISRIQEILSSFDLLQKHYERLQNELFPLFEQTSNEHSCVKLMWAIQNTALDLKKQTQAYEGSDMASFWKLFSNFYFNMEILRYRETYILYPVAYRALGEHSEKRMENVLADALFSGKTGALTFEQLELIFRLLPLDIAFIGADDRVKFYSDPPHRIFPRSPQVIGRLVQNCHPPKSVATVEEILSSFKEGREDSAEFYLVVRGAFVHIQYYAVRSMDGKYLGTLEVTQDATHLRSLSGEKRLL
ncbi:PAS domain-containing protein [uncultured Sphaerochaeta sp.]|uniref:PAS domain-containing protein n=1 Tax=uncultured Sphaerochaeta sp. TaxID=886478 RepID=UPI002AA61B44|nr:PAS domain-containing protein [uncultured Sphaerochaeta sp.]